jgi:hypothetical protein
VKFLAGCEADSIKLENCPAYIREEDRAGKRSLTTKQWVPVPNFPISRTYQAVSNPTEFERTTPLVFPRDRGICVITRNLRAWPTERNKQRQSGAAPRA